MNDKKKHQLVLGNLKITNKQSIMLNTFLIYLKTTEQAKKDASVSYAR